ncbi:hypothetical protein [Indioceanicola profundi]|uniref:hypothetical protein n=1 Tax=Indioceanicola profundi TaxID=2220096 RepID=UPI000E6AAD85|nr:hypothetical protein [Indioceanicola profundi]
MLPFLRTRLGMSLLFALLALVAWAGLLDRAERAVLPGTLAGAGERVLEENLTRAAALFATARTLNAAISVLQSAEVTAGVSVGAGVEGTVVPGQALDPINDLIERFSAIMLSATVALGAATLLVTAGDVYGFGVLLPLGLLLAATALWLPGAIGSGFRRGGQLLLVAALVAKVGLPVAVLATEQVAEGLVQPTLDRAEAELAAIDLPTLPTDPAAEQDRSWLERLRAMTDIGEQIRQAAGAAASLADTVIALTVAYVVKILVLPVVMLWLLGRVAEMLIGGLLPKRQE